MIFYRYLYNLDIVVKNIYMDIVDMCEFFFILFFVLLVVYYIGLEKIEGRWEWIWDSILVFDLSLWNVNEFNG